MKLSIITINYNNALGLQKTIDSVISQTFTDYEYIIIDGGSTDGSKEIIEKYADKITYWVSEKDNGIYNAMNKGIKVAKGEYCLFLNSGDHFFDNSVIKESFFVDNYDLIYGNIQVNRGNINYIKTYPIELSFSYFFRESLPHPATFIKRELLNKNSYNENLKICSDWEFFILAICKYDNSYKYINELISVFYTDGLSSHPDNLVLIQQEKKRCIEQHFKLFANDYTKLFQLIEFKNNFKLSRAIKLLKEIGFLKNIDID